MSDVQNASGESYVGILQCPLRRGFIEFEYQPGDHIFELEQKVKTVWGSPEGRKGYYTTYAFVASGAWVILCQDEGGAYVPLKSSARIPLKPPAATSNTKPAVINQVIEMLEREEHDSQRYHQKHFFSVNDLREDVDFLSGAIHERDVPGLKQYPIPDKRHINLILPPEIELQRKQYYSIRLIALISVIGG